MSESFAVNSDPVTCEVVREGRREIFLGSAAATAEGLAACARQLQEAGAEVIGGEVFGTEKVSPVALGFPLTRVTGGTSGLGGAHLHALTGPVQPLLLEGQPLGTVWDSPHATECLLSGLYAPDTSASRPAQARATYERMEEALDLVGMDFSHVARTWLFLEDILAWYGEFNDVRTRFFTERGVFDRLVPASTGIGGSNPAGAAMMTGVYAVKPKDDTVTVQAVPSPLQCPALAYGSSFSRAVEVAMPGLRRLYVSGTAGIAPDGKTAHLGDVVGQTALTCDVVAAILHSRGLDWGDVTRATAYVRYPEDAGVFEQQRLAKGLPPLPVVVTHNVICRDDLLFELEVDAVRGGA